MKYFKLAIVINTALFVSYHTQIFIRRIEPNTILAWLASLLIEAMLILLAMQKSITARLLLIPVFCVSVVSASASFIVQNEQLLVRFITQKRVIEELQKDISETQNQLALGSKYTTKTLQRERALKDELHALLKQQTGDITLINSLIFLVLVLVLQSVSVYIASTLKNQGSVSYETGNVERVEQHMKQDMEHMERNYETDYETDTEQHAEPVLSDKEKEEIVAEIKKLKSNMTYSEIADMLKLNKTAIVRLMQYPSSYVSNEVFLKVRDAIKDIKRNV